MFQITDKQLVFWFQINCSTFWILASHYKAGYEYKKV